MKTLWAVLLVLALALLGSSALAFELPGGPNPHPYFSTLMKDVPLSILAGEEGRPDGTRT